MVNKAYATLSRIKGKAVVYRAHFLPNVTPSHAIHFVHPRGVHAYVDVSEGDPVAITLIHPPDPAIKYVQVSADTPNCLSGPYKLAVELVLLDKLIHKLSTTSSNSRAQEVIDIRTQLIDEESRELSYVDETQDECAVA